MPGLAESDYRDARASDETVELARVVPAVVPAPAPAPGGVLRRFRGNHLLVSSVYQMLATVAMAAAGFAFWTVAARLYTPAELGEGTALISGANLLGLSTLLGLNLTLLRFLPTAKDRDAQINTAFVLVGMLCALAATCYIVVVPRIVPHLLAHPLSWARVVGFVVLAVFGTLNILSDSIFIAYRAARYNFLLDGLLQGASRLGLSFALVGLGGYGVFCSYTGSATIAVAVSIAILAARFGYRPRPRLSGDVIRAVRRFTATTYVAYLLNLAPGLVMPLIIVSRFGAAAQGYYYPAFMIANVGFTVAYSVSTSLFAEASHEEESVGDLVRRAVRILATLLLPAAVGVAVGGNLLLELFGHDYRTHAGSVLVLLAASTPLVAVYDLATALLRMRPRLLPLLLTNLTWPVALLTGTAVFAGHGLLGVGLAWITGQAAAAGVGLLFVRFGPRSAPTRGRHRAPRRRPLERPRTPSAAACAASP